MDDQIVVWFCLIAEFLHSLEHHEDHQCQLGDAGVLTTMLAAVLYFGGNVERARLLIQRYMPCEVGPIVRTTDR